MKDKINSFAKHVRRGRTFEIEERAGWEHVPQRRFEAQTRWNARRGRIDIKIEEKDGAISIIEIKATDWDVLEPHRLRPTAHRHARQIWRYVNDHVTIQGKDVCPGLVYEYEPASPDTRALVEDVLNQRCVQVVWRKPKREA